MRFTRCLPWALLAASCTPDTFVVVPCEPSHFDDGYTCACTTGTSDHGDKHNACTPEAGGSGGAAGMAGAAGEAGAGGGGSGGLAGSGGQAGDGGAAGLAGMPSHTGCGGGFNPTIPGRSECVD